MKLGDVFIVKGNEYVFLGDDHDTRYAVRIRNTQESSDIVVAESKSTYGSVEQQATVESKPYIYSYVRLSTQTYHGRLAVFARWDWPLDDLSGGVLNTPLNQEDREAIISYIRTDSHVTGRIHRCIDRFCEARAEVAEA